MGRIVGLTFEKKEQPKKVEPKKEAPKNEKKIDKK